MSTVNPIGGTTAASPVKTQSARAAQPLDRAKLDALRAAIQAGRYPLDPVKLAERMVSVRAGTK